MPIYINVRTTPHPPTYAERVRKAQQQRIIDLELNIIPELHRQVHKNPKFRLQLQNAKRELSSLKSQR